jgi:hypothetical protein
MFRDRVVEFAALALMAVVVAIYHLCKHVVLSELARQRPQDRANSLTSSPARVERQSEAKCLLPRRALAAFETSRDFTRRRFVTRRRLQFAKICARPRASL